MAGFSAKILSFFALLAVQTTVALVFKVSQLGARYEYAPSSAQTTAEVVKLLISGVLFTRVVTKESSSAADPEQTVGATLSGTLMARIWARFQQDITLRLALHICGLAVLYCFNNQLAFVVFRLADAASVTLVKSASTAVSAILLWLFLSRPVTSSQWIAITLQSLGLFVAQYDSCKKAPLLTAHVYLLLLCSLLITSASGVANEKLLKGEGEGKCAHARSEYLHVRLWYRAQFNTFPFFGI